MSRNRSRCHRRSAGTAALVGIGNVMIWSAAIPLIVIWYTVKVLAILALAIHDALRYRTWTRPSSSTGATSAASSPDAAQAHRDRMAALLAGTRHADLLDR